MARHFGLVIPLMWREWTKRNATNRHLERPGQGNFMTHGFLHLSASPNIRSQQPCVSKQCSQQLPMCKTAGKSALAEASLKLHFVKARSLQCGFWPWSSQILIGILSVEPKRVVSKRVVSADVPPERKPERGYVRQNHPFGNRPFISPVSLSGVEPKRVVSKRVVSADVPPE